MTPQEAIQRIKKHNEIHSRKEPFAVRITEALIIAVETLEKEVPQKPIRANRIIFKNGKACINDGNGYWKCPICTDLDVPLLVNQNYCHNCGQSINWEDNNARY